MQDVRGQLGAPIAEPIPQVGDDFMRGVTVGAGVAAVLDQRHFRAGISQDMIAPDVYGTIEPGGSYMSHEGLFLTTDFL
jgi:hypothetical protein